jgi:hypothetical protein
LEAHRIERKLSAIFAADVEGYSRLMGQDEVGTLRTLTAYRVIIDRLSSRSDLQHNRGQSRRRFRERRGMPCNVPSRFRTPSQRWVYAHLVSEIWGR